MLAIVVPGAGIRNHGFLMAGGGLRLSPLYDVAPKPQVRLERRLVLGVGPQGRSATLENALVGAAAFDLSRADAGLIIDRLCKIVAARWEDLFEQAGIGPADRGRFATCFRLADQG